MLLSLFLLVTVVRVWRDSKAVMPRPAKPFRPVRLRLAPPSIVDSKILIHYIHDDDLS
jgi:hypothetical protein